MKKMIQNEELDPKIRLVKKPWTNWRREGLIHKQILAPN